MNKSSKLRIWYVINKLNFIDWKRSKLAAIKEVYFTYRYLQNHLSMETQNRNNDIARLTKLHNAEIRVLKDRIEILES